MRMLTLNERALVVGGLMATKETRLQARGVMPVRGSRSNYSSPVSGIGGYGGGYGYLGQITGFGNYSGDNYFDFGTAYADTDVAVGDHVVVTSTNTETNTGQCVLQDPSGSDIAWGVLDMVAGSVSQVAGVLTTIDSDGLAYSLGGMEIAFGSATVAEGAGKLELHCAPSPKAIDAPHVNSILRSGSGVEVA